MIMEYYDVWEESAEMTDDLANDIYESFDVIMEDGLSRVNELITKKKPDDAFSSMIKTTSLVNAAITKQPKIILKLSNWVAKLQGSLQTIGINIGADQISIAVGFPAGISVSLAWNI